MCQINTLLETVLRLQMHSYARHLLGDTKRKGVFVNLWNGWYACFLTIPQIA